MYLCDLYFFLIMFSLCINFLFITLLSFSSCQFISNYKIEKEAKTFLQNWENRDIVKLEQYSFLTYDLSIYRRVYNPQIIETRKLDDTNYQVLVKSDNRNVEAVGVESQTFSLLIKVDSLTGKNPMISDTHNFIEFDKDEAIQELLKLNDKVDFSWRIFERSDNRTLERIKDIKRFVRSEIKNYSAALSIIESRLLQADRNYDGSVSGSYMVTNSTSYTFNAPKYVIGYKDRKGNVVATDDGYITVGTLKPGERKTFSFYTNYVPSNASNLQLSVEMDDTHKLLAVLDAKYTGSEFMKWKERADEYPYLYP